MKNIITSLVAVVILLSATYFFEYFSDSMEDLALPSDSSINTQYEVIKSDTPTVNIDSTSIDSFDYHDLYNELSDRKVPYRLTFTKISILESGWNYESNIACINNNIFGFKCQSWFKDSYCLNNHSAFESKTVCIDFLEEWIKLNPPFLDESAKDYITRRNYNPHNWYWDRVQKIEVELK